MDRGMKGWRVLTRTVSLREAAAIIFALTAILPLLVFVSFLSRFELIMKTEAQVALLLAVLVAIVGFMVFRRMVDRISRLAQAVGAPKSATVPGLGRVAEIAQIRRAFKRLREELRGSAEHRRDLLVKLVILNEMGELAARIPTTQDLLDLVLERTMRAVRATVGSIMLLDRESQKLRIAAARGLPDEVVASAEVNVGEGIAGKVVQLGEPLLVDDIETDPRFARTNDPKYGGGSFISVPVRVGDRVIGVLNVARKEGGAVNPPRSRSFSPIELRFLNALMTYVAYALDNARLLEEARQSAKRRQEVDR